MLKKCKEYIENEDYIIECLNDVSFIFPEFYRYSENRKLAIVILRAELGHDFFRTKQDIINNILIKKWFGLRKYIMYLEIKSKAKVIELLKG